jgi:flagellar FliL protein
MAKKQAASETETTPASGKNRLLWIVLVLLLGGGGAGGWVWYSGMLGADANGDGADGRAASKESAQPKTPVYLPLERFTVNFDRRGKMNFLQTDVQLMAYDPAVLEAVRIRMPAIRNRLIMLLTSQEAESLLTIEGKEALRAEVVSAVREVLGAENDAEALQEAFFTSFVLQ